MAKYSWTFNKLAVDLLKEKKMDKSLKEDYKKILEEKRDLAGESFQENFFWLIPSLKQLIALYEENRDAENKLKQLAREEMEEDDE
jgi:hypothetical protein